MFPGLSTYQETWLENNVSWFVYLLETWLGNNVSWFVHLKETWLEHNVFWFVQYLRFCCTLYYSAVLVLQTDFEDV